MLQVLRWGSAAMEGCREVNMRPDKRTEALLFAVLALLALLIVSQAFAQAEDPDAYGDDYQPGNFGRVQYHDNGMTILRAPSETAPAFEEAGEINSPVFPGDAVLTDVDQRVEVQLARGSVVHVDRASDVTFLALPDPYAVFPDNTVMQVAEGALRIHALLAEDEEFRIDTPASSIYLLSGGDYRIEVAADGRTRVFSRRGVVEFVGEEGSILVRAGQASEVDPGRLPSEAEPFNTFLADSFDRWVEEREAAVYLAEERMADTEVPHEVVYEEIPYEVRPYYEELAVHGSWGHTTDYGYVWYPTGVAAGWKPYLDGYWSYGPDGYFWVSYEPWGWAPYHYGRWSWIPGRGWGWIPGRVFGGAWVAWSWGSVHVGWSPLDYWNRPAFVSHYYLDYYDPYCWTFVRYENIARRHYPRYAVPLDRVGSDLQTGAVVTRPPRVAPTRIAVSSESRQLAQRRALADRQGAIPPVRENARGARTLRDLDDRLLARGTQREARNVAGTAQTSRPGSGAGAARRTPAVRERGTRETGAVERPSTPRGSSRPNPTRGLKSYPRQISSDEASSSATGRGVPRGRRFVSGSDDGEGSDVRVRTPGSRNQPRSSESQSTNRRLRDLYERMAQPRTTRDGSKALTPTERSDARRPREDSSSSAEPRRESRPRTNGRDENGARKDRPDRSKPRDSGQDARSGSSRKDSATRQEARSGRSGSGSGGSRPSATRRNETRRPTAAVRGSGSSAARDALNQPRETTRSHLSKRARSDVTTSRPRSGGSRVDVRSRPRSGSSAAAPRSTVRSEPKQQRSSPRRSSSPRPTASPRSGGSRPSSSRPKASRSSGGNSETLARPSRTTSKAGGGGASRSSSRTSSRSGSKARSSRGGRDD
jgi:hypothetical protein